MLKLIDSNDGFTIIEVLIVLTIAAFIILIVLLAVPALERASRNNSHKQAAVYILQAYSDWIDQNGISNFGEHGFSSWYVDCGNLPASTSTFCMTLKSAFSQRENNILAYGAISAPPPQWPPLPTNDQLILSDFAKCTVDGSAADPTSDPKNIVILYGLETSSSSVTTHCIGSTASPTSINFSY